MPPFTRSTRWTLVVLAAGLALLLVALRPGIQHLEVIGQPTRVGALQSTIERPFFDQLARTSRLPVRVRYAASDGTVADAGRLGQLRAGSADIVSMRFPEAVSAEPSLSTLDVVGASPDLQVARDRVVKASGEIDRQLAKRWNSRLMGVFPMGPQVVMCRQPVRRLADLRGARVRVVGEAQAAFMYRLAAIPARIPFLDVEIALNDGLVDCAISSLAAARAAGWLRSLKYVLNISVQYAMNGYVMAQPAWEKLGPEGQRALQSAFDIHVSALWDFADRMHQRELRCHRGEQDCPVDTARRLSVAEPTAEDLDMLATYSRGILAPATQRRIAPLAVLEHR